MTARVLAVAFAPLAGGVLAVAAGVSPRDRFGVFEVAALVLVVMQLGETGWRFVWAAEDGERLLGHLPVLVVATGVPMVSAVQIGQTGTAIALGGLMSALVSATVAVARVSRPVVAGAR